MRAYEGGKRAREKLWSRTPPYYEEKEIVDGRRVDITEDLNKLWLAGYDNQPQKEVSAS